MNAIVKRWLRPAGVLRARLRCAAIDRSAAWKEIARDGWSVTRSEFERLGVDAMDLASKAALTGTSVL
jgi:hypothetical protein